MNYIKNNKVFIFLFISLSLVIMALSIKFFSNDDNNNFSQNPQVSTNVEISNFSSSFSDVKSAVELSWNIANGNKKIEKIMLHYNDVEIKDVTNSHSITLPLNEYDIMTGNNKFDLLVTFNDGTNLSKSKYVYINEAYNFLATTQNMSDKSIITITYSYDKRRPLDTPSVRFSNTNQPFSMNFISSEIMSESANTVKKKVVYELLFNNSKRGEYNLPLVFSFSNYNLDIDYSAIFNIATDDINE